jgi:hypothetical protein
LFLAVAVVPVERRSADPRLPGVARRFDYGTLVAIAVLLATGAAMASHLDRWSNGALQLKPALSRWSVDPWYFTKQNCKKGGRRVTS